MCKLDEGDILSEGCHCIVDLSDFGIEGLEGKGCVADMEWIDNISIPILIDKDNPSILLKTKTKTIVTAGPIEDGKYGIIEIGYRSDEIKKNQLVVIKKSKDKSRFLLKEALIQKVVYESLCRRGFPNGASRVYDLIATDASSICFTMEAMYDGANLQHFIEKTIGFQLVNTIIESLLLISSMLWHLGDNIGMNHRDLKPSNIILRFHDPCDKVLTVRNRVIKLCSHFDVTFIDFGFSCIGLSEENGGKSIKLGKSYDKRDPCPKEGRDLYMFLAFIYFYTHKKLPRDIHALFEKWLNVEGTIMTDYLKSPKTKMEKDDVIHWIYAVTGCPDVVALETTPECIFHDLQKLRKLSV
jgi:hypothetical protein